ncbi:MAG: RNA polymerase sigma factor [Bacilli bacterium]
MSDEDLFARVMQGDGYALAELYDRHARQVYAISRRLTADPPMLEEIIQDVFTKVWTTRTFDPKKGKFVHWLSSVARRTAIDHMRKAHRRRETASLGVTDSQESVRGQTADDDFDAPILKSDLIDSMSHLRAQERTVVEMAYFQGYTLSEIASVLEIPIGTVKTRLHRALKILKSFLEDGDLEVRS